MSRFLPYILRNVLRNKVRTVLTVLGMMVVVAVFCFLASIESSMKNTIDEAAQTTLLVLNEKDQWWPTKSQLPGQLDLEKAIEEFPHVKGAMPVYVMTNTWGKSGGLVKIEGIDKEKFTDFIPARIDEETLARFRKTPDGALLGKDFMERYKGEYPWKIGESYKLKQLRDVSITFVGTFESENEVYNSIILSDRRYLQEIKDSLGTAHQVLIRIDNPKNAGAVIAALDEKLPERFPFKTTTRDQRSFISTAVEDLRDIIDLSYVVILITLTVMLVAVANTVSMVTRDRTQEFGILRSLGFRQSQIMGLVIGESLVLTLFGGLLGLLAALCFLNLQDSLLGLRGVNIQIQVTPLVALLALAVAAGVGLFGGLLPAIAASRLNIVSSLRNVD